MRMKDKLIGAGAVLLAFGGLGSAAAFASSPAQPDSADRGAPAAGCGVVLWTAGRQSLAGA